MNHDEFMYKFSRDRYACETTGVKIDYVEKDYARCSLTVTDAHLNGNDCVMGGAIFTLADYCFGVAANYGNADTVTLGSSISFMNPSVGPTLYAEAKCSKSGRSVAFYDVTVTDSTGRTVATVAVTGFRKQA